MFYLKRSSKEIAKIIFNCVYTLFLFIHGINKKEKKKECLKRISFLPPTSIWIEKCIRSRENKICTLIPIQYSTFDQVYIATLHKTSFGYHLYKVRHLTKYSVWNLYKLT